MNRAVKLYVILAALYCAIIVTTNLIFQKYVRVDLYFKSLEISVGELVYPITFVISDLIAEFYPRRYAEFVPAVGVIVSFIICLIIFAADMLTAVPWSPLDDASFHEYFGIYGLVVFSSVIVNYIAQIVDIRIYKFLKSLCKDKYLWLRNNVSTIIAQIIDSVLITTIFCFIGVIAYQQYFSLIIDTIIFKSIIALLDTPILYSVVFLTRRFVFNKVKPNLLEED